MQSLFFVKKNTLEWRDVPDPVIENVQEAIVRPLAVARCDLDPFILRGQTLFRGPFPFGHEFVGEVVTVGSAVRSFQPGDQVVIPFQVSCGSCVNCGDGLSNSCLRAGDFAHFGLGPEAKKFGGAFSDLVKVPFAEHMLMKIPDGINPVDIASISDNMTDAYRTVAPYHTARDQASVLVLNGGAPSIGLYTVALARALGVRTVKYLDADHGRLALAERLGADPEEMREIPKRFGQYDITVDATSTEAGLGCALRSTRPGGHATSVGIFFSNKLPIPYMDMYNTGVHLHVGRCHSRENVPPLLDLIRAGRFDPKPITSRVIGRADAIQAMGDPDTKLIVRM